MSAYKHPQQELLHVDLDVVFGAYRRIVMTPPLVEQPQRYELPPVALEHTMARDVRRIIGGAFLLGSMLPVSKQFPLDTVHKAVALFDRLSS